MYNILSGRGEYMLFSYIINNAKLCIVFSFYEGTFASSFFVILERRRLYYGRIKY